MVHAIHFIVFRHDVPATQSLRPFMASPTMCTTSHTSLLSFKRYFHFTKKNIVSHLTVSTRLAPMRKLNGSACAHVASHGSDAPMSLTLAAHGFHELCLLSDLHRIHHALIELRDRFPHGLNVNVSAGLIVSLVESLRLRTSSSQGFDVGIWPLMPFTA